MNSGNDIYQAPQAELGEQIPDTNSTWFNFQGRLGRLSYFGRSALAMILSMILAGLVFFLLNTVAGEGVAGAGAGVVMLGLFWVSITLLAKRLHDINLSGWWMLLTFIPLLGLLPLLYFYFKGGAEGGNRFGYRPETKGWEKLLGGLFIVLLLAALAATIYGVMTGGMNLEGLSGLDGSIPIGSDAQ